MVVVVAVMVASGSGGVCGNGCTSGQNQTEDSKHQIAEFR